MSQTTGWAFPEALQPNQEELRFDLQRVLDAVVMLHAEVPEDAFTAGILGTERVGNAVAIREDGLLLTIGYLITEAETIWLTTNNGTVVGGHPLAYDFATGLGLVQPLGALKVPALRRGSVKSCARGEEVLLVGHGGRSHALKAKVIDTRLFAGYWEYLLDEAMFTAPAHPQWGGAALVNEDGQLLGIGSLLVQEAVEGETVQGNMIVPIDLLEPILEPLLRTGSSGRPPRPWLGMYSTEVNGDVVVAGLAESGPAHRAGVRRGDLVREVAGERVQGLADLFRKVWRLGQAGVEVPLTVVREGNARPVRLKSADRTDFLRKPKLH
jgi:S1-C subfamily serine protease